MSFRFNQGDRPLPGYTIQRGVGRGGFGEVYYALSDGGKEVALKYLRENPQVELRGATHCLNLKSPYLVALHDIKQSVAGEFFVIMEFVNGASLRDLMNEEPRGLGTQKAAYFTREIAKGLAYLHDRGIVHRDLKPGNIFYEDGYVKIGDYGLSKMMAASQHSGQTVSVGTVHYMAPEVGSGNYDRTIDIYALGVILYEMLLGRVPFSGSSMGEVLMKHLTAQPEVDELPAPFPHVIRKALAKDPNDRYQTVNEMMTDLFDAEDLSRSVGAFEPASISTLASRAARKIARSMNETLPAGGGHAIGTGSSNIGQFAPPPIIAAPLGNRMEGRIESHPAIPAAPAVATRGLGLWPGPSNPINAVMSVVACSAAAGAATVMNHGDFEFWLAMFLHGVAFLTSVFLWQSWMRRSEGNRHNWNAKLALVVLGIALTYIVNWLAVEMGWGLPKVGSLGLPLAASFVFVDWRGRLDEGRRGTISAGSAMSAAAFGVIAWFISEADLVCMIAILAGASLGIQALGALWPIAPNRSSDAGTGKNRSDASFDGQIRQASAEIVNGAAVGISRDGSAGSGRERSTNQAIKKSGFRTSLPERHPASRALWFVAAGVLGLGATICFIALPLLNLGRDEFTGTLIGGVVQSIFMLFAISCAVPRFKKGLWRGIFRKGISFAGVAIAAGCGIASGQLRLTNEEFFGLIIGILVGAIMSLIVWVIPVPMPSFLREASESGPTNDGEAARLLNRARKFRWAGFVTWGIAILLIPTLLATVPKRDWESAFPATMIPLGFIGLGLHIAATVLKRRARKPKPPVSTPVELPLRRSFRAESLSGLRRSLEQYAFLNGYRVDHPGELLWRLTRGEWIARFWQSDVRKWKTEINLVATENGQEGYWVNCMLDIDAPFHKPDRSMLRKLDEQLGELQALIAGAPADQEREIVV
ncbi:MAG: serine/threonine protein kinase [Phycisphaerae bacterium]|nr:serine/threonine protein kinase [Phycisphaerae bacterium]